MDPQTSTAVCVRYEDADSETELSFVVEGATPSALALEVTHGRRFRLRAHERRLMWARVWRHFAGVTLVTSEGEESPGILSPMVLVRADESVPEVETQEKAVAIYERHLRPPDEVDARVGMNSYLTHQFRRRRLGRRTPATWVPALVEEWDAEVRARLGADEASLLTSADY